jgi:3-hydroxyacyl-[acyl-carrier-protein] dehydratase
MPPAAVVDPSTIDTSRVLVDREGIRLVNPQRFEMEQLTAIVALDPDRHLIIGYKDLDPDEFWVRGHLPGYPLMPGVMICEAAAQLVSFFCHEVKLVREGFLGFGGMEDVRFRGQVKPGDRLVLVGKAVRLNRRQTVFETQGFVDNNMVYHGRIIGVPLLPGAKETPKGEPKGAEV